MTPGQPRTAAEVEREIAALVAESRRLQVVRDVAEDMTLAAGTVIESPDSTPKEAERGRQRRVAAGLTDRSATRDHDRVTRALVRARWGEGGRPVVDRRRSR